MFAGELLATVQLFKYVASFISDGLALYQEHKDTLSSIQQHLSTLGINVKNAGTVYIFNRAAIQALSTCIARLDASIQRIPQPESSHVQAHLTHLAGVFDSAKELVQDNILPETLGAIKRKLWILRKIRAHKEVAASIEQTIHDIQQVVQQLGFALQVEVYTTQCASKATFNDDVQRLQTYMQSQHGEVFDSEIQQTIHATYADINSNLQDIKRDQRLLIANHHQHAEELKARHAEIVNLVVAAKQGHELPITAEQKCRMAYEQGVAQFEVERYTEALLQFNAVVKLDAKYADTLLYRGRCFYYLNRHTDCINDLKQWTTAAESDAAINRMIGMSYLELRQWVPALQHLQLAHSQALTAGSSKLVADIVHQMLLVQQKLSMLKSVQRSVDEANARKLKQQQSCCTIQ